MLCTSERAHFLCNNGMKTGSTVMVTRPVTLIRRRALLSGSDLRQVTMSLLALCFLTIITPGRHILGVGTLL